MYSPCLASTILSHSMECLLFIDTPEETGIGGMSSMQEEQCSFLEGHFCSSNLLVHAYCILGVGALLAHNDYLQTNDNHRRGDLNHYFIIFYLFENLEQF